MKRPTCRGSSVVNQETTDHQEDSSRYVERQGVDDGHGAAVVEREDAMAGAYDDDEEEDEDELGGSRGGLGERKRRLAAEQVRALERSFEVDNKLDPERKARIARDLRLHPRQVAVWFQNHRARWKTKQIERDFAALRARHDAFRHECDELRRDKDALAAKVRELREKQMAVKLEASEERRPGSAAPSAAATTAAVYKDGSTDSDSSAVFNEEASPYSGGAAAFDHHQHLHPSFTGFTSFLASSSALSSSFPSLYLGGSHFDQQEADAPLGGAGELGGSSFFAEEQGAGLGSWYDGEGW